MSERHVPSEDNRAGSTPADERLLELQVEVLRALGHPARLQILQLLRNGPRCVCEIEPALRLRQPNISQHLAILRAADLVATRREGLRVIYRVVDPAIFGIVDLVTDIVRRQGAEIADAVLRGGVSSAA